MLGAASFVRTRVSARAAVMLLLLAALWGSSYLFIKIAVEDGLSPSFIAFGRLALGALVLVPVAARNGTLRAVRSQVDPAASRDPDMP